MLLLDEREMPFLLPSHPAANKLRRGKEREGEGERGREGEGGRDGWWMSLLE